MGCNQGQCPEQLNEALARFEVYGNDIKFQTVSEIYHTEPQGRKDQPWFLNQVAHFLVDPVIWSPEGILSVMLAIEGQMGRMRTKPQGPRPIDLDLLLFGDLVMESDMLTLPHPRMLERAFVLVPLLEIAPDLVMPDGTRIDQALKALNYTVEGTTIKQD